jgi:chorismate mutase
MMNEILEAIDRRIAFAKQAAQTRPHEQSQWFTTQKQFETLRNEVAQGMCVADGMAEDCATNA